MATRTKKTVCEALTARGWGTVLDGDVTVLRRGALRLAVSKTGVVYGPVRDSPARPKADADLAEDRRGYQASQPIPGEVADWASRLADSLDR